MRACNKCGITLRGSDQEGDICLTCLSSLTPHCNFDQGYSTIEGCIRQTTNNKIMNNKPTNLMGAKEKIAKADNLEKVSKIIYDLENYKYISDKTLRKIGRIIERKSKEELERTNALICGRNL